MSIKSNKNLKLSQLFILCLVVLFVTPVSVFASYYTLPIDTINDSDISLFGYFDHDADSGEKVRYDGETVFSYDDHHGLDYLTNEIEGKEIYAAADGNVRVVGWENPMNHSQGYGFRMYLYHGSSSQRTVYAHLIEDSNNFDVSESVIRGDVIASSGDTGLSTEPHLHFGVYDCDCTTDTEQVDPYGWSGGGSDPWPYNTNNYLWTNASPSFVVPISGTINSNSIWGPNVVHLLNGSITLAASASLDIEPGAIVKFQTDTSKFLISGDLNVNGTASSPSYFTSYKDDTVGGDTNGDGSATSPASSDWNYIQTNPGSTADFDHAVIRYGDYGIYTNNGGIINVTDSLLDSLYSYGFYLSSSSVNIDGTTIQNTGNYGVYAGGSNGPLTLTNNTFIDNNYAAVRFLLGNKTLTSYGNIASGSSGDLGMQVSGTMYKDQTWGDTQFPYIITTSGMTISSGKTLTLDPGVIFKPQIGASALYVSGTLSAIGSSSAPIYFTSYRDDTVGGDTNHDGSSTNPTAGDWRGIRVNSGGTASISYAKISYAGNYFGWTVDSYGGNVDIDNSILASASVGFKIENSGTGSISSSSFINTSTDGVLNQTTATVSAENNWWGASNGPLGKKCSPEEDPGSGVPVSSYVDFCPFITATPSWP